MAMQSEKAGGVGLTRGGPVIVPADKPKGHEDMYLCVALVVLLAWALFVGLGAVNWSAVSHTFKALLAAIA